MCLLSLASRRVVILLNLLFQVLNDELHPALLLFFFLDLLKLRRRIFLFIVILVLCKLSRLRVILLELQGLFSELGNVLSGPSRLNWLSLRLLKFIIVILLFVVVLLLGLLLVWNSFLNQSLKDFTLGDFFGAFLFHFNFKYYYTLRSYL